MSCDSVEKLMPLYFYGELSPAEEEQLEDHLHGCVDCARELEAYRRIAAVADQARIEPPAELLSQCRAGLAAALEKEELSAERPVHKGPWTLFLEAIGATFGGFARIQKPAGALALVAVGFFAARFTGSGPASNPQGTQAGLGGSDTYVTVRSIQPDASGQVRISFDETRRREITGRMDDQNIQRLALAGVHEENPALRLESVDLLKQRTESGEVRDAFANALTTDPNPGVRMKALEGLKPFAADPVIRRVLTSVLLDDDYPAVRMQAIDLLAAHRDDSMVGVFQGLMQNESNDYVRAKAEKALKDWNASVGTF